MVQLNLLPDVKLDYIKAQRSRRLVLTISTLATVASLVILGLSFSVDLAQKKHLSDLNKDINSESSTLQNKPDIGKILTVQNQLESLTALHAGKPAASRLFDTYLNEITPVQVAITSFHIDFTAQTATITGTADSLATVNKYVDTLKFTTYTTDQNTQAQDAFSNVVLSSFGLNTTTTDPSQAASYTITISYDKNIFDITQNVTLSVPSEVTTRSQIDQPGDLFKVAPGNTTTTKTKRGSAVMADTEILTKRVAISKANAQMVGIVAAASFITIFCLVSTKAVWSQNAYQARVTTKKEKAHQQLLKNISAYNNLTQSYEAFVSTPTNVIGGNSGGSGPNDGDNGKIVLDALPPSYDFPALTSSIEKILTSHGLQVISITGTDDQINQQTNTTSPTPQAVPMPFTFTITHANYTAVGQLITALQQSIRPIQIDSLDLSGGQNNMTVTVDAHTYYQPGKSLNIAKQVVK